MIEYGCKAVQTKQPNDQNHSHCANEKFSILLILSDLVFVFVKFFGEQLLANLKRLNMEHQFRIE